MSSMVNNKNLREKIHVKDLFSFQCRDNGELVNYFTYLMRRDEGFKLIQMRIDDSEKFTNDLLSILSASSLEKLKKSGITFEKQAQKALDIRPTIKYTIEELLSLRLVSKAIRSQVIPILEELKLLRPK